MFFAFLWENLFEKNFSCWMSAKHSQSEGTASAYKRQEFWHETHTPLWVLIGHIIFLTCGKTSFAILIWGTIFFTCEKHHSLLWLARTYLRMKNDIAFQWVYLSTYVIKAYFLQYYKCFFFCLIDFIFSLN